MHSNEFDGLFALNLKKKRHCLVNLNSWHFLILRVGTAQMPQDSNLRVITATPLVIYSDILVLAPLQAKPLWFVLYANICNVTCFNQVPFFP